VPQQVDRPVRERHRCQRRQRLEIRHVQPLGQLGRPRAAATQAGILAAAVHDLHVFLEQVPVEVRGGHRHGLRIHVEPQHLR